MSTIDYVCRLPVEVQNYARDVLNETEENRRRGLKELKEWAEENAHLNVRTNDEHLLPFLRVSKYDMAKVKQKLINFYTMRRDIPEWFENRDPNLPNVQKLLEMGCFVVLKKTFKNHLVVIVRPNIHDPKMYHLDEMIKASLMLLDVAVMEEELAQIYGVFTIIDMANLSFSHIKHLTPPRIKKLVNAWQNFHCRPQRIEFVNAPTYINVILDVFKSFMSAKLRGRTFICYDGFSSSTDFFDKEVLPEEYGGVGGSLEDLGRYWSEKLITYSEWFKLDEKYKAEKNTKKNSYWFTRLSRSNSRIE